MSFATALLCGCPLGASLTEIPSVTCPESMGQIQKLWFQRKKDGSTVNKIDITVANEHTLNTTYSTFKAASDNTKLVVSPFVSNPETEAGAKREFGGGNQTIDGVPIILGREGTVFTAQIYQERQDVIAALKLLECEDIMVYMIDENGDIWGHGDDLDSPTEFRGFYINKNTFFVGDKNIGGLEEPDSNEISFALSANWSDNALRVTPADFDALYDL